MTLTPLNRALKASIFPQFDSKRMQAPVQMNDAWKAAAQKAEAGIPVENQLEWRKAVVACPSRVAITAPHGLPEIGSGAEGERFGKRLAEIAAEKMVDVMRQEGVSPYDITWMLGHLQYAGIGVHQEELRLVKEGRDKSHAAHFSTRGKATYRLEVLGFFELILDGWAERGVDPERIAFGRSLLPEVIGLTMFPEETGYRTGTLGNHIGLLESLAQMAVLQGAEAA